jgi:hypothetical protein
LSPDRQPSTVTQPPVGPEVHETLDVHGHFTAEVALHDEARNTDAKRLNLRFCKLADRHGWIDTSHLADLPRPGPPDPVDRREGEGGMLGRRYVDTRYSGHGEKLPVKCAIITNGSRMSKALALPLLVASFLADHPDDPSPLDDLAISTNPLD